MKLNGGKYEMMVRVRWEREFLIIGKARRKWRVTKKKKERRIESVKKKLKARDAPDKVALSLCTLIEPKWKMNFTPW